MIAPARVLTFQMLTRIETKRLNSDAAVNAPEMAAHPERDRHLATEIIYGVLRRRNTLDWLLTRYSSHPWRDTATPTKIILRLSLYQLWFMERIPDHALVNDAVELAKTHIGPGPARYINGILRQLTRLRPWQDNTLLDSAPEHVAVALPQWLWLRWRKRFGKKRAREFALSLLEAPRAAFRLKNASATAVAETLAWGAQPAEIVPGAFFIPPTGWVKKPPTYDNLYFQDEASQLIPWLVEPLEPGSRVWDVCAAPGGKSAILSHLAGRNGILVASDINPERVARLAKTVRAAAAAGARQLPLCADASQPPWRVGNDAGFALVCADVPCSGLGTLRRNPEIKWRLEPPRLFELQATQRRILASVAPTVRAGGRLLYSTCSTEPEENEQVVENFLATHPDFRLTTPTPTLKLTQWLTDDGAVRTFPSPRLWDGFFAAIFQRE